MNQQLVILQKTYDLMLYVFPLLSKFPKNQRFTLAQHIQNNLLDMAAHITRANMSRGRDRWLELREINACLEVLRLNTRLSMELGFLPRKQWEQISIRTNEIGKLLGGWMKTRPGA